MAFRKRFKTSQAAGPTVRSLAPDEFAWIPSQIKVVNVLITAYSPELLALEPGSPEALALITGAQDRGLPTLRELTDFADQWLDDPQTEINTVIDAIGTAVGQHISDATGLQWVSATDDHGTEYALHGNPGNIVIYPHSLVGKRLQAGEPSFVETLTSRMITDVQALRPQA